MQRWKLWLILLSAGCVDEPNVGDPLDAGAHDGQPADSAPADVGRDGQAGGAGGAGAAGGAGGAGAAGGEGGAGAAGGEGGMAGQGGNGGNGGESGGGGEGAFGGEGGAGGSPPPPTGRRLLRAVIRYAGEGEDTAVQGALRVRFEATNDLYRVQGRLQ